VRPPPGAYWDPSMAFEATLATLYRWADKVLRLDDTPPRLAAAYAWGVTVGFSPFFGLHLIAAFIVAFAFRLNKLLVLAGVCTNVPWIMVPWFTATTAIAGALLGVPLPADLRGEFVALFDRSVFSLSFLGHLFVRVRTWIHTFIIGLTIGALLRGLAVFSWCFLGHLFELVRPWILPFIIGPTVGAIILGLATYPAALLVMQARQRQRARGMTRWENRGVGVEE